MTVCTCNRPNLDHVFFDALQLYMFLLVGICFCGARIVSIELTMRSAFFFGIDFGVNLSVASKSILCIRR
jgi:hypothetical protein